MPNQKGHRPLNIYYVIWDTDHCTWLCPYVRNNLVGVNSSPNDKISIWSKLKPFADGNKDVTKKLTVVLGRVENIVGKGENAGNQHFLHFPQYFQKDSFSASLKAGIVW